MCLYFLHVTRDPNNLSYQFTIIRMQTKELIANNQEVETLVADAVDKEYSPRISEILDYSKEYLDAMQKNYPNMTMNEIIEAIENQKDLPVRFHHRHEWITGDLIKKYLIIDKDATCTQKITLETPERHDCNLVKLTPELQDKSYRWYRWDRRVVSHLIDRKDYPWENKTNKLTIIGKRDYDRYYDEDIDEQVENKYFRVITAFRWDWKSRKEPTAWHLGDYDYEDMEYWMNHALIPEKNEEIRRVGSSGWSYEYEKKKKQRDVNLIYQQWKDLEYQAFVEYVNKLLSDLWREYDKFEIIKKLNPVLWDNDGNKIVDGSQYIMVRNKWKFWIIEIKSMNDVSYKEEESIEWYRKRILEKDYSKNFKSEVLKEIDNQNYDVSQQIVDFRQWFIRKNYNYKAEILNKIIQSAEQIKHSVEIDGEGNKLSTIILWNKEYKILEPNLENHTDENHGHYKDRGFTSIHKFKKKEVDLDWIRWDNPDWWLNKKFAEYVKEKKSEWFHIPWKEFEEMLLELWKVSGSEKTDEQLLLLIYLTWMDGDYRLSMSGDYRSKLRCEIPMLRSNIGNVYAWVLFIKS